MSSRFANEDQTSYPWPFWLLRYIGSGDESALNAVIWSVGGSPPYGNISYKEAEAVYNLLEQYLGPGMAPEEAYEAVRQHITDNPERLDTLELFRIHDRIASAPEDFTYDDIAQGITLTARLNHTGVRAYFLSLQAQLDYGKGDIPTARQLALEATLMSFDLALEDNAYKQRLVGNAQNAISFCAMDGDFSTARQLLNQMAKLLPGQIYQQLRNFLGDEPKFGSNLSQVSKKAGDLLEGGNYLTALEWYTRAEQLARKIENEPALCGLLGDKAFAFNRLGNILRAIETYQKAIALSRTRQDWVNLSRWNQNLGLIYLRQKEDDKARSHLKEALDAALTSNTPYQVSTAVGNYATLLHHMERYEEAIQALDQAITALPDDVELNTIWRAHKFGIYGDWGRHLEHEGQTAASLEAYSQALHYADHNNIEVLEQTAPLAAQMAALYEQLNDRPQALSSLDQAIVLFRKLGNDQAVAQLDDTRARFRDQRLPLSPTSTASDDVAALRAAIAQAMATGDEHAEATARVNLAGLLMQQENSQAIEAFEEAMALVRRMQDRRSSFFPVHQQRYVASRSAMADRFQLPRGQVCGSWLLLQPIGRVFLALPADGFCLS